MNFRGRGILLDIEGTTSSVDFVVDVMFPFVRRELESYLAAHWGEEALAQSCELIAVDAGHTNLAGWCATQPIESQQQTIRDEVVRLMDGDVKATGLKSLQGLIWHDGFASGELVSHVYDDVVPAIEQWREQGIDVRIYSSGSTAAQRLFFGHTEQGDLLHLFTAHYDTQIGSKKEAESYAIIASEYQYPASDLLFVSDVTAELDAARLAGWKTTLCQRPGNALAKSETTHAIIERFSELIVLSSSF